MGSACQEMRGPRRRWTSVATGPSRRALRGSRHRAAQPLGHDRRIVLFTFTTLTALLDTRNVLLLLRPSQITEFRTPLSTLDPMKTGEELRGPK